MSSSYYLNRVCEADIVKSTVTHLASALIFSIDYFILQLIREDFSDVQLVAVFKQSCQWVHHIQGGLLFIFTYLKPKVRFAYISCKKKGQGDYKRLIKR